MVSPGSTTGSAGLTAGGIAGTVSIALDMPAGAGAVNAPLTLVAVCGAAGRLVTVAAGRADMLASIWTLDGSQPSIAATAVTLATMTAPAAHSTSGWALARSGASAV